MTVTYAVQLETAVLEVWVGGRGQRLSTSWTNAAWTESINAQEIYY